jgi:hypothetical protein
VILSFTFPSVRTVLMHLVQELIKNKGIEG